MVISMQNIQAIFLDIDGTITDNKGNISNKLIEIIKKLKEKKIEIVLASGRNYLYTKKIAEEIGASSYVIASNGAVVANRNTNEIIYKQVIPEDVVLKIYDYCITHNCLMHARCVDKNFDILKKEDITTDIVSINIESNNYDRMLILKNMFNELIPEISITNSSKALFENRRIKNKVYFHDLCVNGTSKGNGILELLEYLKLDKENIMCVGDSNNDISMALISGYSIAMGNATKELKIISNKTIKSNEEKGLEEFLQQVLVDK